MKFESEKKRRDWITENRTNEAAEITEAKMVAGYHRAGDEDAIQAMHLINEVWYGEIGAQIEEIYVAMHAVTMRGCSDAGEDPTILHAPRA